MKKTLKRKKSIYLCGAMEAEKDLGVGWRAKITPFLEKLGFNVLNPCDFEPQQLKGMKVNRLPKFFIDKNGKKVRPTHWHQLKNATEKHLYNRFLKYMRLIIKYDIDIVEKHSNYVVVFWNEKTGKGAGSHSELTSAFLKGVPIYCVLEGNIPAWARACCTEVFNSFDELKEFLVKEFK